MKEILNKLTAHHTLTQAEARQLLLEISSGVYSELQVAVFMGTTLMRTIGVEELKGYKEALLELCVKPNLECNESIDMCGTGGDGKNTFNISTTSAFVVAGAGYKVSKHGNYGVSSLCGSSNVLESLGYKFNTDDSRLNKELDQCNICFLHAPLFHPAMKFAAPIRKAIGTKTFFNMLGPLVNPVKPTHQSVGVYSLELARLYQYIFEESGTEYSIVHGLDGYDEVSLTSDSLVITNDQEVLLTPRHWNINKVKPSDIHGGETITQARDKLVKILKNTSSQSHKEVVMANAALAIKCFEKEKSFEECRQIAKESLDSGAAFNVLNKLINLN